MNLAKTHSSGRGRSVAGEVSGARCRASGFTSRSTTGFTLIELLVVIAVIAILAALIFPVTGAVNRAKIRSKARAELGEVQLGIDNYKAKLGHYPPDNPGLPTTNQLYFELLGTTNIGTAAAPIYQTLDGSARVAASFLNADFGSGVSGFVNCTPAGGGDEGRFATPFLSGLKPGQIASMPSDQNVKFIVCSVPSPNTATLGYLGAGTLTPFYYNSSNPTNNPGTYDLWVDVMVAGKTNRISNWNKEVLYP
ncbi:MAG TPA: prepilin-type N-terminal cleavage/methylation domain-containing protein [Candidatus Acidoferrum sp.]|jgi:prepilin-type N-terminal cleavage/methylation domain-containing protein|nr:prepilin-type N-terminal cleavage/methylation domain-containing protein [Candidatus Acidoferrum sp.]